MVRLRRKVKILDKLMDKQHIWINKMKFIHHIAAHNRVFTITYDAQNRYHSFSKTHKIFRIQRINVGMVMQQWHTFSNVF